MLFSLQLYYPDMRKSIRPEINKVLLMKVRRLFTLFSITFLSVVSALSQPVWVPATPSIGTTGPLTIPVNYGIDRVGTVYIAIQNFTDPTIYTSALIKTVAIAGPSGTRIYTAVLPVTAGNINTVLQVIANVVNANRTHTVYITAEAPAGVFVSANAVRLLATTAPCPQIDILTGFSQPLTCITQGPSATFQVVLLDPPTSGILKGTQWTIDWGDGSPVTNYTSAADYDIPPLALRQHTYTSVTSCNYVFSSSVVNPCGESRSVQYVAVVHGRDIPADGDGILSIVNNATGNSTVEVCAGNQTIITLRDNSTWNCQSPILPGGLTPVPNSDPRNIEWLYGRDPAGIPFNTITGTVSIASLGDSPQSSGRISPSPYGPSSLSQTITIPASCQAGQYFRVYLKNWNKCNWSDPDYVSTFVDILVVAAPPAPTAPSRIVCIGDDRTLSVTSAPVGTITWYSDAGLTTPVGTGLTYVPSQTTPGSYNYYVTDKESTGLLCQSAATTVTLTISPKPNTPTITYPNKNNICFGVEPPESYTITASVSTPPPVTGFQWYRDGVLLPGRTYDTIYITKPSETGRYTVRAVGAAPSYCLSDSSLGRTVTVHTLENVTPPRDTTICELGTAIFHAETTMDIHSYAWEVSYNAGVSYTTVGANAPYSDKNTETLTITQPPVSFSGYWYRLEMMTPNGQGGCRFKSPPAILTVDGLPTANAGTPIVRCSPAALDPIYMTGAVRGGSASSVVWSGGAGLGTWTQNITPALAYFTPSAPSGSFTATLTVTGTAGCGGVVATSTRNISWSQTPAAEAGANSSRCDATPLAPFTMTGASATGTYSALNWSGGAGLGTWVQNADPALAVFTPTVASGSFTATLTLTGSEACAGTNPADTRIISWAQTPVAVAGPAFNRCDVTPLAAITMTGASSSGTFINQTWSGGAGLGNWTQNANPALATFTPTVNSGSFTATLSLTGTGACTGTDAGDTRLIEWSYAATVNAGPDQSICAAATVNLAGTMGGSATSATWTGGAGTYVPDNTTLNAVYTPSLAERTAQTVTLTLTTNDPAGICPAVSDDITISIGTVPSNAVLTTSGDWCFGDGASWLNVAITGGAPPYRIRYRKNGIAQADIFPYTNGTNFNLGVLAVGAYTYEVYEIRDNCGNIFNTAPLPLSNSFTVWQKPVANAGSDNGECNSLAADLNAIPSIGTGTWSQVSGPGTITFTPDVNAPAATATASQYGAYVVRWTETNGICTSSSDITVAYERLAAAGAAQNLCGTLSATLAGNTPAAGTGTWTKVSGPGTVSFSPNANTPGATATVSAYGTYILKWTIANGIFCSTNQDVTITFEKAANAGAEQHLCGTFAATLAGNTPAVGTGTWSFVSGPAGVTFSPTINTPGATATVTQYGTYVFKWTIANGAFCTTNQNVTIVYNPSGQVNQPSNQEWCNGDNTLDIIFSTTNIGGTTSYSWNNSASGIGLPASGTGDILSFSTVNGGTAPVVATIVVTPVYSDGVVNCPGPTKTFTITVNPTGQVNQPADQTVCNASGTAAVIFSTLNTVGSTSYSWSNDNTSIGLAAGGTGDIPSFTAVNTGLVPVTANITVVPAFSYGGVDCPGPSKIFTITVNPTGQVTQPLNQVICNNSAGSVTFTTVNGGGTTSYSWTNSNTSIGLPLTGTGNISFTGTNAGTAPITGTIVVTPVFTSGGTDCPGPAKTFTITVNPTGQVNQPADLVVCNGLTGNVAFSTVNTVGTTSFYWTNTNTSIGLAADGTGPVSFIAVNPGTAPVSATIVVTPTFNFGSTDCPGPSKSFTITVNPTPALSTSLTPPDLCSNTLFSYDPASLTALTTFNWNRAVVAGITPAGPTSGTNNPNETLRNITNIPLGVTYQYTLTAGGCSNVQNVMVNIKPEPVIVPGQTSDLCSGNGTNYHINLSNFINPVDNVTFTWPAPVLNPVDPSFTGGAARSSASAANIADVFTNTMGVSGTATYTVTPYKDGCAGSPVNIVMTIRSQPVLDPGLNTTVCSNTAIGLLLQEAAGSVSADYYNISAVTLDAGLSADAGNAAISNPTAPAAYLSNDKYINITGVDKNVTYRVQPVHAPDCFGAPVDVVITIRPQPYIVPAQTKTICSGILTGKEILLSPVNIPAGTRFNWPAPSLSDFSVQGSAGVNVAADPAGTIHINDQIFNYSPAPITATYNITPSSSLGCTGTTIPVVITINPEPVPKPISGRDKICIGELNIVYDVASSAGSTYHWSVDPAIGTVTFDFNTNAIILNASAAPGSGNISVYETNSFACDGDPSTLPVQVYTQATPENVAGPASVCANSTQVYSVTARAGSVYSWTIPGSAAIIGDPSAASVTIVFGNVGGAIDVRETNIAGCITEHNALTVTVKPLPTAVISGGGTICEGSTAPVFVDFAGTAPFDFTYAINGVVQPPVNTSADPYTLNATLAGTYTIVNVSDATSCTNTGFGSALVTYYPKPTGIISGGATLCGGASTILTMTFTGTAPYTFAYTDGTTTFNVPNWPSSVYTVSVSPATTTTYTLVSLTDGNTCPGAISGSAVITINEPPVLTLAGTNLTCNNDNSGAVDLTATGNSPFGFAWTGPLGFVANTEDISGLKAGAYNVTVTDTKGCTSAGSVILTEPGPVNATLSATNIFCFGSPEGTITISAPSGGSGSYEYTIDGGTNWQVSGNFTGLNPGTYDIRMRDALAPVCNKILNGALVLTGPAELNATVAKTDIICYDAANGSIAITNPAGGFGTYGYSINGGTTWQGSGNFPNLIPGFYTVMIRDAANPACMVTLSTVNITQPPAITAVVSSTNVTCFGSSDGTITISGPAGGSGTYEYSINGGGSWQISALYSGVTPGTYNVQIRDAANPTCYKILNATLTIIQPDVLKATVASTMISCNGADDGVINITGPTGGSGTYEYTIQGTVGWQASGSFTGLTPGSYDVRIRDAANTSCEIILNGGLDITEPSALSGTVVSTDITCFGADDGTIRINNSLGGYGTYEYTINGGLAWQSSNSFAGLSAGTYNVQMRDKTRTSCVLILDPALVIAAPPALSAALASTNVTCFNANDGTITISAAAGGYGTYQYTVNGGTSWQGSGTFTNLSPGSYDVRIRDAASPACYLILNAALVITQPPALSATLTKTNITCFGASDGTITVNGATGGYGTYEYTIDGGGTWQASNSFTGLGPGFYNVRIRDAVSTSCIYTVNNSVNVIEPAVLNATIAKTNITCNGADDGSITISSPTGGYGTYEFSINGGADWQSSGSFVNLGPAARDVKIRDAAQTGCIITLNPAVLITEPAVLSATLTSTNITCFGANNGTITVSGAAGGYGTYEYSINGGGTWAVSGNFNGLAPGSYNVIMRDAVNAGCILVLNSSLIITQPASLAASYTKTDITCYGANNGEITVSSPVGGHGTYEYTINGGGSWQNTGSYTGLGPGTYNVQMRDAAQPSCVLILNSSLTITQPLILNASIATTMVSCNGANDGIINITAPTGGSGSYEYTINGGVDWFAGGLFTTLAPSTYDVRIRDAVNSSCVIVLNGALQLTEPVVLNASVSSANITCNGSGNGSITISGATGGYGSFDYSIDGGSTWQATGSFTNLIAGSYNVQIRDKVQTACVKILDPALTITEPAVLTASVTSVNVTCFGANNGSIIISGAAGGYGTYQYSIDGGVTWLSSGNFTGLVPGSYNVRIRDAAYISCFVILSTESITQPNVLSANVANTNITCSGANDGTITISLPSGGYGTYEYTVDGGSNWQASGNFTGLAPGFYNVQIRDALYNTCVIILNGSLRITEPNALSANVTESDITCNGAVDGKITISLPTGGYGTYEYSIDGGFSWQVSGTYTGLVPGSYNVQIRDAVNTGCVTILNAALTISEPPALSSVLSYTDVTCNGISDGTITITGAAGGYGTYQYTVNGGTNWFGSGQFTGLAPGTYDVRIRDAANPACYIILDALLVITEPAALNANLAKTDITCFGSGDGTIEITLPVGGYGTYEYTINGGGSWQSSGTFTGLTPGNYYVLMRDAAHISCRKVLNNSMSVTQPAVLNAVVSTTMVTCNGVNDGKIEITSPSGGYGTYEYSVNGGVSWSGSGSFTGLAPSTYNIKIRDAANTSCVITLNSSLVITEPPALTAVVNSSDVTCNGADDGAITISSPAGGYGTYEYSVDGAVWLATGLFSNLAPATYNVQIRDKSHPACFKILNGALVITEPAVLSATVTGTNVTCNGTNDGTVTISSPAGGYGTYGYSVNGGASWQSSPLFISLAPGMYDVRFRDAANPSCVKVLDPALSITQPPVLNAAVASSDVTCYGAADGTIIITSPSGGYGTFEYTVTGGTTWQTSGTFTALAPGFYNVKIRDAANTGCTVTLNGSLRISEPSILAAVVSKTNVSCNGVNDGTISIAGATGGYGTYEYTINGGGAWSSSGNFTGLAPSTYDVRIRDAAHTGCVITLNSALVVTEPAALTATVTSAMVTCAGANNGTIAVSGAAGGSGTYLYSIDGGTSWQGMSSFSNLAPGNYDVRLRDAATADCFIILNPGLAITQPPVLDAALAKTDVTCFGGADGSITVSSPTGGYGNYEFSINGGGSWQGTGTFTGLMTGSYNVMMRDKDNITCIKILNSSYLITQPGFLTANLAKTDVSCFGANDGTISITSPAGGYGTYQYSVNGGSSWENTGNYSGLIPGTYVVRLRDAAYPSCYTTLNPGLVIGEPLQLSMTNTGDIVLNCFGDLNGSGAFYSSNGTMPYTFSVVINTAGATIPASGFNSQSFTGAGIGSVTIRVTDNNGCSAQSTINISQPAALTPGSVGSSQVLCSGQYPAQITEITPPSGGPGGYTYQWQYSNSSTGPFITVAGATSSQYTPPAGATSTLYYRRMVTAGVCTPVYSNVVEIRVNPLPLAYLTGGETICPGQSSNLKVDISAGTGPFEMDIENYPGLTLTGYVSGSDIAVSPLVNTTYKLLRVRDANGCQVSSPSANLFGSATVNVRLLPAIVTSPADKTTCEYGMTTFNVSATGSDLTYQWYVNEGSGFTPLTDGGLYFGVTTSSLMLFGTTRLMDNFKYHVVVSGCSSSVTSSDATLKVNTSPEITRQPHDTTVCVNAGGAFSVTTQGTSVTHQWEVNKGSGFVNVVDDAWFSGSTTTTLSITNAQGTFNNYYFRVKVTGLCGAPVYSNMVVLKVNIAPTVTINPVSRSVCDNAGNVSFAGGGTGPIDSLRWQVNTGAGWTDIYDDALYSGTMSQQLTVANAPASWNGYRYRLSLRAACINSYTNEAVLTVNQNPVVDFSTISPMNICGGVSMVLNGDPTGGSGTYTQHTWTGDVGPLSNYFVQSPAFRSVIGGSFNLNYKVKDSNGCMANDSIRIIVDAPDATYLTDITSGCTPLNVTFTNISTGAAKFWWNFDDGSPVDSVNANPAHEFTNTTGQSIEYRAVELKVVSAGGCFASYKSTITIFPDIQATITAADTVVCSGSSLTFTATPGATKYFWEYGDGVSGYSTNVATHVYTNITTEPVKHTVRLTTTSVYNCFNVRTIDITVMPMPLPQFQPVPATQIFDPAGNQVTFNNNTNPGTWDWQWKFGDGAVSVAQSPSHTYTNVGEFTVTLTASNSYCSDSAVNKITVTPQPPVAQFDSIPSGCTPYQIRFNNTSLNLSTPGTTIHWDFGDGNTSTTRNPSYIYTSSGIYRVTLTVTGPGGVSTMSRIVESFVTPEPYFKVSPTYVFVNDEAVRCFNLSSNADYYVWDFGDGDTSKVKDPYHKYMDEGVYDITLHAYSNNGCYASWTLTPAVTVEPAGELRFSTVFIPNKDGQIERTDLPTGGPEMDQFFFPPIREKIIDYKLQIFNRLGLLIFESRDINIPWNGYYKGRLCTQGVYVWYVEGKYANGRPFRQVGDVTLLH